MARGTEDLPLEPVGIDRDLQLLGLGEHHHGGGGGMDPALGLRLGDPLHSVYAALELEP